MTRLELTDTAGWRDDSLAGLERVNVAISLCEAPSGVANPGTLPSGSHGRQCPRGGLIRKQKEASAEREQ